MFKVFLVLSENELGRFVLLHPFQCFYWIVRIQPEWLNLDTDHIGVLFHHFQWYPWMERIQPESEHRPYWVGSGTINNISICVIHIAPL